MLENTESQEMYLTTIYALQKKNGMVRSVDVADERGYSKVSVHNAMKRLEEFGYVTFHQGKITLTKCGRKEHHNRCRTKSLYPEREFYATHSVRARQEARIFRRYLRRGSHLCFYREYPIRQAV